ncbi:hypothetical protein [Bermanella sp. R86510]|uniref:hypothetical protein n=1 Tax=unclassified Bermanella TaxID=2627862 RepID=UPI0037C9D374
MAAIHLRGYLFFSAIIPTVIYMLVAWFLIALLSTRITESLHYLSIFVGCLGLSAILKMGKDAIFLIPYAVSEKKFSVTKDDSSVFLHRKSKSLNEYLKTVILYSIIVFLVLFSALQSMVYLLPDNYHFLTWIVSLFIFPLVIFLFLFDLNRRFYLGYDLFKDSLNINIEKAKRIYFIAIESLCFLLINLSLLVALNSLVSEPFDVQFVTVLIVVSMTTFFLLLTAGANCKNQMKGLAYINQNSQLNQYVNQEQLDDPRLYKLKVFSLSKWLLAIVCLQVGVFLLSREINESNWFFTFVFIAESIWLSVFIYLRSKVVSSTLSKVILFRYKDALQLGKSETALTAEGGNT